jgi:two-component system chemotaxis response regulator CheY
MNTEALRFLVVDDHVASRYAAMTYLQNMGVDESSVREAEDGAIALKMLHEGVFDFVITDVSMPNMNGIELLKAIKADPALKNLPVLMASMEGDQYITDLAILMGAFDYLLKPYTMTEFETAVQKGLQKLDP